MPTRRDVFALVGAPALPDRHPGPARADPTERPHVYGLGSFNTDRVARRHMRREVFRKRKTPPQAGRRGFVAKFRRDAPRWPTSHVVMFISCGRQRGMAVQSHT